MLFLFTLRLIDYFAIDDRGYDVGLCDLLDDRIFPNLIVHRFVVFNSKGTQNTCYLPNI